MSTTRIVFIIVCVVLAAIFIVYGLVFQRNNPDGKYSVTNMITSVGKKRRRGFRLPVDSRIWMAVVLALFAIMLLFVFSKR